MFYCAEDEETAIEETFDSRKNVKISIAKFCLLQEIKVIDFCREIMFISIFDNAQKKNKL